MNTHLYEIKSIPERLEANPYFTGKGITICVIDSGFYYHPDLTKPVNRILTIKDIATPQRKDSYYKYPHNDNWHGMMTSIVAAGNGSLSNGRYRSIAPNANLVLLRVKTVLGISATNISRGIRWAIENKERYNIRIINLSITDDYPLPAKESIVSIAAEEAFEKGIVVVAAAGNNPNAPLKQPASSPNVITVGGIVDNYSQNTTGIKLYHSTYGKTLDNLYKPEILAPADFIPSPILPGSEKESDAEILFEVLNLPEEKIDAFAKKHKHIINFQRLFGKRNNISLKEKAMRMIAEMKLIDPNYMTGDGTSLAAPIVCSVIAQMLEVNPHLSPQNVRDILIDTAVHLKNRPAIRQGAGVINPKAAVNSAEISTSKPVIDHQNSPVIDYEKNIMIFRFKDSNATRVNLCGTFNNWDKNSFMLRKRRAGWWMIELPLLKQGKFFYKYLVDSTKWEIDRLNPIKEPDPFNGFNSVVEIK
ncbi:MAG: S8 family serine peptidase [Ignavibacteriaceae bacterium]|nr:S8 family serine peptidase [Ignavibacteriaceae bacterium]